MTGQQAGKDSTTMGILQEYIIHLGCKVDSAQVTTITRQQQLRETMGMYVYQNIASTRNNRQGYHQSRTLKLRNLQAYCGNVKESIDTGERGDKARTGEGAKLDRD